MSFRGFRFLMVLICSITLGGAMSGCVSKGRYNRLLSANQACEQRAGDAEQQYSRLHQQLVDTYASFNPEQSGQNLTDDQLIAQIRQQLSQSGQQVAMGGATEQNAPVLSIMAKQLFPSGSARLTPEGRNVLAKVATWLKRSEARHIFIEGYTDTVPIGPGLKQKYDSNWELSTARATSVLRFLAEQGVPEDHMAAVGYGEQHQIQDEMGDAMAQSRRVEVKLHDVEFQQVVASLPQGVPQTALIDINSASVNELVALPGITPEFARGVVEYRARAGRISSYEDLRQVRGFDEQKMAAFRSMVTYDSGTGTYEGSDYGTMERTTDELRQEGREGVQEVKEGVQELKQEGREGMQEIREEGQEMRHDIHDMNQEVQEPGTDTDR